MSYADLPQAEYCDDDTKDFSEPGLADRLREALGEARFDLLEDAITCGIVACEEWADRMAKRGGDADPYAKMNRGRAARFRALLHAIKGWSDV